MGLGGLTSPGGSILTACRLNRRLAEECLVLPESRALGGRLVRGAREGGIEGGARGLFTEELTGRESALISNLSLDLEDSVR
jgi:hypothetical protein